MSARGFRSFVRAMKGRKIAGDWVGRWVRKERGTNKFSSSLKDARRMKKEGQFRFGRRREREGGRVGRETHFEAAMFLMGSLGASILAGLDQT